VVLNSVDGLILKEPNGTGALRHAKISRGGGCFWSGQFWVRPFTPAVCNVGVFWRCFRLPFFSRLLFFRDWLWLDGALYFVCMWCSCSCAVADVSDSLPTRRGDGVAVRDDRYLLQTHKQSGCAIYLLAWASSKAWSGTKAWPTTGLPTGLPSCARAGASRGRYILPSSAHDERATYVHTSVRMFIAVACWVARHTPQPRHLYRVTWQRLPLNIASSNLVGNTKTHLPTCQ